MQWSTRSESRLHIPEPEPCTKSPLRTLDFFFENTSHLEHPALLDMGSACNSNIRFFGLKGFKIYVEDFLSDYLNSSVEDAPSEPKFLQNYPLSSFDGILCWDIFEAMKPEDAGILIERLFVLLKGGGFIIALFDAREELHAKHVMRHKIIDQEMVIHEPAQEIPSTACHYKNREIMQLFCQFEVVKSYYHKNRLREYLFKKLSSTIS
ncbi:MAG: hypothetical protein CO150_09220 [Nitrospirae bacterium CG_4_9_14_3_um_filter_53_35]|nr:MAG: hypothetical protein AUK29_00490 [Nitrospirae bacterium CG2_30_53_67]PIS37756.1 MAG: hypothetical protein COT35_04335 [Nitrospirae bacterium CG08_land_8_20_14_0_20_52_24]PIV82466.1 MAG: hypothetical protein COW52_13440 [Nitrospirae bacterium CG17_big_fil_post_rev_8_21_14_2_50_50_9]PIW86122.1 MAG: hypothetical protein COZ95_00960 [Nitrospirae bacterium CG_4_8_14_3_um_filter_50_41]PIX86271.1 MAG: hypothetical protein COZ32_04185 [Nitrospirae bacterium CG_4_10_14_3_um_filter_53_41]PJA7298